MSEKGKLALAAGTFVVGLLVGVGLSVGVACAQEVSVGTGLLCDTADQVVAVGVLVDEGKTTQEALDIVNSKTPGKNPNTVACDIGSVAFVEEGRLSRHTVKGKDYDVVKIKVVGVASPLGVTPIPEDVQFTALPTEGPPQKGI
jgi:hypothetical protein